VWLLGLAWAVWHYPLTAIYALSGVPADAPAPAGVVTVVIALLSQTLGSIGLTYLYVWLFNRTHSIFLMIVFHALTNALPFLVPPALGMWALVVGVFPWIIALVLWLITRHDFLCVQMSAGPGRAYRADTVRTSPARTGGRGRLHLWRRPLMHCDYPLRVSSCSRRPEGHDSHGRWRLVGQTAVAGPQHSEDTAPRTAERT
jgi:hypothetical protein